MWRIHFQGLFLLLTHCSFFSGKLRKNKVDLFGSILTFLVGHMDCGIKVPRALPGQLPPRETVPKPRLPVAQEHIRLILESVHRAIWRYTYRYTINSAVVFNEGYLFISHKIKIFLFSHCVHNLDREKMCYILGSLGYLSKIKKYWNA